MNGSGRCREQDDVGALILLLASYSPECVEGEFFEVRMYPILGSWHTIFNDLDSTIQAMKILKK